MSSNTDTNTNADEKINQNLTLQQIFIDLLMENTKLKEDIKLCNSYNMVYKFYNDRFMEKIYQLIHKIKMNATLNLINKPVAVAFESYYYDQNCKLFMKNIKNEIEIFDNFMFNYVKKSNMMNFIHILWV